MKIGHFFLNFSKNCHSNTNRNLLIKLKNPIIDTIKIILCFYIFITLVLNSAISEAVCSSVFSELRIKLNLPNYVVNILHTKGINNIEKLTKKTAGELSRIPHLGRKSLNTIEDALAKKGLYLKNSHKKLKNNISILNLSKRAESALYDQGINTVEKLVSKTQEYLLGINKLGEGSLMNIEDALNRKNLSLKVSAKSSNPNDISNLGFSIRTQNVLRIEGINTIEQLIAKIPTEILRKILLEKENED